MIQNISESTGGNWFVTEKCLKFQKPATAEARHIMKDMAALTAMSLNSLNQTASGD